MRAKNNKKIIQMRKVDNILMEVKNEAIADSLKKRDTIIDISSGGESNDDEEESHETAKSRQLPFEQLARKHISETITSGTPLNEFTHASGTPMNKFVTIFKDTSHLVTEDNDMFDVDTDDFEPNILTDDDNDDEVVYVGRYQRSDDVMPVADTTNALYLVEMEQRVRAAEQRTAKVEEQLRYFNARTSSSVCIEDLLQRETLRMPCGHICCKECLQTIAERTFHVIFVRCPECRHQYSTVDNCLPIIFPYN